MANELFKGYSFELEGNKVPVAVILPPQQEAVVGSIAKLDGRASIDPESVGLTFTWSFTQIPIGSQVERAGFTALEDDLSIVSFAPDIIGTYKVQLVVSDGSLDSDPVEAVVDTRVILVPHHSGYVPDASFIWNYLSDFWNKVDGRKKFETFWSAAIQIVSSEMLKLYQYDYNKSIRDIQEVFQRRWVAFEPGLALDRSKVTYILGDDQAGLQGSSFVTDPVTGLPTAPQPAYTTLVAVPTTEGSFERNTAGTAIGVGRLLQFSGRSFTRSRSASITRSTNYGVDGSAAGADDFYGGGFDDSHEGQVLKVLSGAAAGDYLIELFVNEGHVQVTELDGSPATLTTGTGFTYTVVPATPSHSAFFADQVQVPAGIEPHPWRLSSTLVSTEHDYELLGVSPGDLLEVEITRTDIGLNSTLYGQIVSVDRSRLGFVLNLADLVDGTPGGWFTNDMLVMLAADLQVAGLGLATDGSLVFASDSLAIKSTTKTSRFRRAYFEIPLTPDTELDLGPFSITARPVQVVRNHRIPVDSRLVSAPILQEYVKQPTVVRNGDSLTIVTEGGQFAASREPYILVENLDYVIDDETTITGSCNVVSGSDEIEIPYGDLIDRSINDQDSLTISLGIGEQKFEIRRVISADRIRVYPTPTMTQAGALFELERRVGGKYLRFVRDVFTRKSPAPFRLWSEVCYFDNNDAVEANFGYLVGVTQEDLERANAGVPYKSAVAGLMYALTNGPTIANLALSAQILLGLPFTQNAGVITEINPDFRKRDDGSPLYGRILVSARDKDGNATGITNIYLYPHGRQIPDPDNLGKWLSAIPDFSGLGINPVTGVLFAVGDEVDQFVTLSKGVQIQEYLATPDWTERLVAQGNLASLLQRYHAFQLLVNSDLVSASDIDFAAQFMDKAKGHYLKLTSALLKSVEDEVDIVDFLTFGRGANFFESVGLGFPSAVRFSDKKDENGSILSFEGNFYTRYISGDDLITVQGDNTVESDGGGFINARASLNESHDEPFLQAGDLLVIKEGSNKGQYEVLSIDDDNELTVVFDGVFETGFGQPFSVYRPIKNPIWGGEVAVTTGDGLISTQETVGVAGGIGSAGVMVGDRLVFMKASGAQAVLSQQVYTIVAVVPDLNTPYVTVVPDPVEPTDTYYGWIVREPLITHDLVEPYGTTLPQPYTADLIAGQFSALFTNCGVVGFLNTALLRPGDTFVHAGTVHTIIANEPGANRVWFTPAASATVSGASVSLYRPYRGSLPVSFSALDQIPGDYLELDLRVSPGVSDRLETNAGSPDVSTTTSINFATDLGVLPGDHLMVLGGGDSTRDVGYGPGLFPILSILSGGTTLRLTSVLTETHNPVGILYGIRRKMPQ